MPMASPAWRWTAESARSPTARRMSTAGGPRGSGSRAPGSDASESEGGLRRGPPFCMIMLLLLRSFLLVTLLALASPGFGQDRIQGVTTTTDLRSRAGAVGGDRVAAVSLVPPNLDAEEYQ